MIMDSKLAEITAQLQIPAQIQITTSYEPGRPLSVEKKGDACNITYGRRVELFRGLGLLAEHKEELDEKRLCCPNDEIGETEIMCHNSWTPHFVASIV